MRKSYATSFQPCPARADKVSDGNTIASHAV
uniref:Uncharacterized protein n=1 Tax=Anguilla anguilla TaxID=7936 RepID=A0A0E9TCM0_ANGAN